MQKPTLTPNGKYKQGVFTPKHPEKYIGKPGEPIIYRSGLEKRYMTYFDETASILKWGSEELTVPYIHPLDNRPHRYFPDFILKVRTKDGKIKKVMIEIKPAKETVEPMRGKKSQRAFLNEVATYAINQAKWQYAREFCEMNDMQFEVMTEHDIKVR